MAEGDSIEPGGTSDPGIWDRYLDDEWLGRHVEEVLQPELAIIDPHHHVWRNGPAVYTFEDLVADLGSGHDVRATVFVETYAMYRADGPEHLRPVGETEYANGIAAMGASGQCGPTRVCAGIVGACDLRLGTATVEQLEAQVAAGNGRLRGVRVNAGHDDDIRMGPLPPKGLLLDADLRTGFAHLSRLGLVCDVMTLHHQLDDVADLAGAFPGTTIVLNHMGAPARVGPWASRQDEVRVAWRRGLEALAPHPNVLVKVGGLANPFVTDISFRARDLPPTSEELAAAYQPWFDVVIDLFGADRCMFESNFPADRYTCSYLVLWNAFKRLAAGASEAEQAELFHGTAGRAYGLAP